MPSKKVLFFLLLIMLLLVPLEQVFSDSQWDITLNIPMFFGMKYGEEFFDIRAEASRLGYGSTTQYFFLLPNVKWHYYLNLMPQFRLGFGLQLWTLLVESLIYPNIALEYELGRFVLHGGIGGGALLFFGLVNEAAAGNVFMPEFSLAYRFGRYFSVGVGTLFIFAPALRDFLEMSGDDFFFLANLFVRWTL